jgi:orotate phosphoribosyltransferase
LATENGEVGTWEKDRERKWVPVSQTAALLPEIFRSVGLAAVQHCERQRLKELLLAKSYRQGTFTLTSGKTSDFYIDGKQTTLDAEGGYLCGRLLFELIRKAPQLIGGVGGMTLGADPLVTAVSIVSHLAGQPIPAFIVRKEAKGHGTGNYLEGKSNLQPGCAVALLEDVVTTGGTLLKVIERVEKEGFKVGMVLTVIDREEGGAEVLAQAGYPLHSVFTRTQLIG